ncbi:MAG TPA: MFS transporter [Pseudoxanthomonas sp.]
MNRIVVIVGLILTYMIFAMLLNSVGTVILQSIQGFGISKASAGSLEAFKDLPIAITSLLVASLLPRLGYRRAMVLGLLLVAAGCICMPMLKSFWATRALFATVGISFALVKVAVYSSIGLLTDNARAHASLTNTVEGWFMVGILGSAWLFAAFINPDIPGDPTWLNVYWVVAGLCVLVATLLTFVALDERQADGHATGGSIFTMLQLLGRPLVYVFMISTFLYVLMEQSINTWLPTFNHEILHLPTALSVQAASVFAGALALGRLGGGVLLRRLPWFWLLSACVLAMAQLVLVAMPLAAGATAQTLPGWRNAPLASYVFPLVGLFMAPIYPTLNSVVLSTLPRIQHASATGLIVVFSALGGTCGSFITGQLFAHFDGSRAFYLLLAPMALLLVSMALLRRATATEPQGQPLALQTNSH